ncbi:hypothetical protein O3P69_012335 [Scylla paramamosain]|uniref:Phospholipase A2-like central domain-containing protein n=1 Tax=Scylla paramamosain TaxID=85552 RepID=A0AAW0SI16_SCYPA
MHKPPLRAIASVSIFFVFSLSLRNPPIDRDSEGKVHSASSIPSLHRYQYGVLNKSAPLSDRLKKTHFDHETKTEEDTLQNESQHGVSAREEEIRCFTESCHKTVMEREMNVGVPEHDQDASQAYEYFPSSLSAITNMTSIGNPLRKDLWRRSWGSHPLPSRTEFTPRTGARWMTFFHDQAVAAVLLSRNDTMYDCIVQEVIEKWEQRKALEYLGEIMPLQPVELPTMVHLSTLCGFLNTPRPASRPTAANINLLSQGLSILQGILPGTLWCGRSDQAVSYRQLGLRTELDSCCRTHDHCPVKLLPMASNYGLTNISLKTKSHCLCDLEFYRCLKAAGQSDPVAKAVGEVYFNFLQLDCLSTRPTNPIRAADDASRVTTPTDSQKEQSDHHNSTATVSLSSPRMECSRRDSNGGCRMWLLNPRGFTHGLHFTPSNLTF